MCSENSSKGKASGLGLVTTDLSQSDPEMPLFNSRPVLWRNVSALMHKKYGREHLTQLAKDARVGLATIDRIKKNGASVGTDVLDKIASALGAEPWQLLHPDFDPFSPENAASFSPLAMDLATQLDEIGNQSARERAHALATQVIGLANDVRVPAPSLAPRPKVLPESDH